MSRPGTVGQLRPSLYEEGGDWLWQHSEAAERQVAGPVPRRDRAGARQALRAEGRRATLAGRGHGVGGHRPVRRSQGRPDHVPGVRRAVAGGAGAPAHEPGTRRDDAAPACLPDPRGHGRCRRSCRASPGLGEAARGREPDGSRSRRRRSESCTASCRRSSRPRCGTGGSWRTRARARSCRGASGSRSVPPTTEQVEAIAGRDAARAPGAGDLRRRDGHAPGRGPRLSPSTAWTCCAARSTVDRQLVTVAGRRPRFGPPKTEASVRTIPLPQVVVDALAAHLAAYPPGGTGWCSRSTASRSPGRSSGTCGARSPGPRGSRTRTGLHALRHYYASLLIRHGESVKTVQARLGHAIGGGDAGHLQPPVAGLRRPDARSRRLGARRTPADSLRTAEPLVNDVSAGQRG